VKRLQVRATDGTNSQILDQVLYIAADSITDALAWEVRLRAHWNARAIFMAMSLMRGSAVGLDTFSTTLEITTSRLAAIIGSRA